MTKTLPDSFSIRWQKIFYKTLKNNLCRVEHTDTLSFIYIDKWKYKDNIKQLNSKNLFMPNQQVQVGLFSIHLMVHVRDDIEH